MSRGSRPVVVAFALAAAAMAAAAAVAASWPAVYVAYPASCSLAFAAQPMQPPCSAAASAARRAAAPPLARGRHDEIDRAVEEAFALRREGALRVEERVLAVVAGRAPRVAGALAPRACLPFGPAPHPNGSV